MKKGTIFTLYQERSFKLFYLTNDFNFTYTCIFHKIPITLSKQVCLEKRSLDATIC